MESYYGNEKGEIREGMTYCPHSEVKTNLCFFNWGRLAEFQLDPGSFPGRSKCICWGILVCFSLSYTGKWSSVEKKQEMFLSTLQLLRCSQCWNKLRGLQWSPMQFRIPACRPTICPDFRHPDKQWFKHAASQSSPGSLSLYLCFLSHLSLFILYQFLLSYSC